MYIKNNTQIQNNLFTFKTNYSPGNIISGKVTSLEGNNGIIKLIDGNIIPVIFQNGNNVEKNRYINFKVERVEDKLLILRALNIPEEAKINNSYAIEGIIKDLKLPKNIGTEIIESLLRFNLPASSENVLSVYNNYSVLNAFGSFTDADIIKFLKKYMSKDSEIQEKHIIAAREIIKVLKNIDINFLSFLIENDIPQDLNGIIKASKFIEDDSHKEIFEFLNSFILKAQPEEDKSQNMFHKNIEEKLTSRIEDLPKIISELKSKIPPSKLSDISDKLDILNHIKESYNIFKLNILHDGRTREACMIIKKKIKNSDFLNYDNIKAFMAIETPAMGVVDCYISKDTNNLSISFGVEKQYIKVFKQTNGELKSLLRSANLNLSFFSVKEQIKPENLINLSLFFNERIPAELDVRI